jgi:general stress protein 26
VLETPAELAQLQQLLDTSHAGSTGHLRSIATPEHLLTARDLAGLLTGMKVLSAATVTATGEPRISALDGHFLHGTWTFSTATDSAKARHLAARPAVSVAHLDGEDLAVVMHGRAEVLDPRSPDGAETEAHWTAHYGSSPYTWGDVTMYRLRPHFALGYASDRPALLARRGLPA